MVVAQITVIVITPCTLHALPKTSCLRPQIQRLNVSTYVLNRNLIAQIMLSPSPMTVLSLLLIDMRSVVASEVLMVSGIRESVQEKLEFPTPHILV